MNQRLWILYQQLDKKGKQKLQESFADAPVMQRLIDFLNACSSDFQTPKAVRSIYAAAVPDTDFAQLTNRFYKLRKQLLQWLLRELIGHVEILPAAAQELVYIRHLFLQNRYRLVVPLLERLAAECEIQNIFELLPEVLSLWLRSLQSVQPEDLPAIEKLERRLGEALDLQANWQKALYQDRLAYRAAQYPEALSRLKRLAQKYKAYPRFRLLYHFTAFVRGAFQLEMAKKNSNAISRHLNNFKAYRAEQPNMPVLYYEPYYQERSRWRLYIAEAALLFLQRQYPEAAQILHQRAEEMKALPDLPAQASEALYRNSAHIYLAAGAIREAEEQLQQLLDFQTQQNLNSALETTYSDLANLYIYAFPQLLCKQYKSLDTILEGYVHNFRKKNAPLKAAGNQAIRVNLAVVTGRYEKAWLLWQAEEHLFEVFQHYGVNYDPSPFYQALAEEDLSSLNQQEDQWQEQLVASKNPGAQQFYSWVLRVIEYYRSS